MVQVGEVGQLVTDDVAHQLLGQEHEVSRQLDDFFCCAVTQFAHATPHLKTGWREPQFIGHLPGKGQQDSVGLDFHCTPYNTGNGALDIVIVKIGTLVYLQMQGIAIPVVEDIAWHTVL